MAGKSEKYKVVVYTWLDDAYVWQHTFKCKTFAVNNQKYVLSAK